MIRMPKTPIDLIDEKMARDGRDAFKHSSLADFLASSGRRLGRAGLTDVVNELAVADVLGYLPAISGALRDLADDDSGEFAALVAGVAGRLRTDPLQGPFTDMLADMGSDRPELAVRLARRLIATDMPYHAAFLVGGAMRGAPAECRGMADALLHSESADRVAAGIVSLRVAWTKGGIHDAAEQIRALAPLLSRPECAGSAADMAMGALLDMCPAAAEEAGPVIEDMARRHARCRSRLAARIWRSPSPLGDEMALRCLSICIEDDPDPQTMGNVYLALARLSKTSPDGAVKFIAGCMFNDKYASACRGHALQEIGRAAPGSLTAAILAKASASDTPVVDTYLHTITGHIAKHADPHVILDALFDALESGDEAVVRPALRMINALATCSHDAARDDALATCSHDAARDDALASSMLNRLELYAKARGINVEPEVKKERDADLKCAAVIRRILHPPTEIDEERVMENLELFPSIKKAFAPSWFKDAAAAAGDLPHPLVSCLSAHRSEEVKRFLPGPPRGGRRGRNAGLQHAPIPVKIIAFLDSALELLDGTKHGPAMYAKKMKNPDQFQGTISEIAFVAPFAGMCGAKVEIEPRVGKKRPDAAITLGGQRVLVEVVRPHTWKRLDILDGPRKVPRCRMGWIIHGKAAGQIPAPGTCADPVVVAVDTASSEMDADDAADYVLGPRIHREDVDRRTGKTIRRCADRDAARCMHSKDARTDSISAVVCFEPDMSADPHAAPRMTAIANPHAAVPLEGPALKSFGKAWRDAPPCGEDARRELP